VPRAPVLFPQRYPLRVERRGCRRSRSARGRRWPTGTSPCSRTGGSSSTPTPWPAYLAFIPGPPPTRARALVAHPAVSQRVTGYRLLAQAGRLAAARADPLGRGTCAPAPPGPRMPGARPARRPPAGGRDGDRPGPARPPRESAGFAAGNRQPGSGANPGPRAVRRHDHAARRPRPITPRAAGDGGHARPPPPPGTRTG